MKSAVHMPYAGWLILPCSALECIHHVQIFLSSIQVFCCKTFTMLWYDASYRCLCVQSSMSSPLHHLSYRRLSVLICLQAPVSPSSCSCTSFTVFGKHCECNAQKYTHLKRLPPLGSHLLLQSHCVLNQHEGKKINHKANAGTRTMTSRERKHASAHFAKNKFETRWSSFSVGKCRHFKLQITTCAENGKIQLTPKITNHLFTYCLNCTCKSNPVYLIHQWSVIFLLASYSPFRGRWDSKCWIKCSSKSWMLGRF